MVIPPKYFLTPKIVLLLQSIEASKEVINSISVPIELEANIRRKSTLKSSLFSARIEGNTLTMETLPKTSKNQKTQEVYNILRGLNWVYERRARDLTTKDIFILHQWVMEELIEKLDLGKFRTDMGAIFNSAGIAIYLPPRPSQIINLIKKLVNFANSDKEQFKPIKAALAHYSLKRFIHS